MLAIDGSGADLSERLAALTPWSHYFKFDDQTYTGYIEEVFHDTGRTHCTKDDDPELIAAFRQAYEQIVLNTDRFIAPCRLVRRLAGDAAAEWSVLDLACNDGFKSLYMNSLGLEKVTGVEYRADCIDRANFIRSLSGANVEFRHHPISADVPEYVEGLGTHDIVCSFGLLYHLENHRQHIANLRALTRRCLVMFSSFTSESYEKEENRAIPYRSVTGRAVVPTKAGILSLLIEEGFRDILELRYHPDMGPDSSFMGSCVYLVAFV